MSVIKLFFLTIFLSFFLFGCANQPKIKRCTDCHNQISFDKLHQQIDCTKCHQGNSKAFSKEEAHQNFLKHPDSLVVYQVCSGCHKLELDRFKNSLHYTYKTMISNTLKAFGIYKNISLQELKTFNYEKPLDKTSVVIDFLRRRCLLCHVDYEGEDYKNTRRGKGCLACHFDLLNHSIVKPTINHCLSCHYSSYIGWDYLGYSPHNWYEDYRSPFVEGKPPERPYGIEAYQLLKSIHYEKGLVCTDCHKKEEVMFGRNKIKCLDCHQNLSKKTHNQKTLSKYRCEVCHANFVNLDGKLSCSLEFNPSLDDWYGLTVQESSEVEKFFDLLAKSPKLAKPLMKDKLTGKLKEGLWLCGLGERTFEKLFLGKDLYGKMCVLRKKNITIYYDEDLKLEGSLKKCISPHSIGKGNLFSPGGL